MRLIMRSGDVTANLRVDAVERVDRIKALGNAVVPQQFYPFFAAIAIIEGESK